MVNLLASVLFYVFFPSLFQCVSPYIKRKFTINVMYVYTMYHAYTVWLGVQPARPSQLLDHAVNEIVSRCTGRLLCVLSLSDT